MILQMIPKRPSKTHRVSDFVTADLLGLTPNEVRQRWPQVTEYGTHAAPYWAWQELIEAVEEQGHA